jgi:hypothetical protein
MTKKRVVASVLIVLIALLVGGVFLLRGGMPRRKPLGEAALIQFQQTAKPDETVKAFLSEDFEIIKSVAALPEPIRKLYTEAGGSRWVLADPGQKFEATDVISDPSLPKKLDLRGSDGRTLLCSLRAGRIWALVPSRSFRTELAFDGHAPAAGILRPSNEYRCPSVTST